MKLVGLAFLFGFLAEGSPSEFLLTSGVLGKIKGSLYQPILFLENVESFSFLFFLMILKSLKHLYHPACKGNLEGQEVVNASK